jgi:hypothetical protein
MMIDSRLMICVKFQRCAYELGDLLTKLSSRICELRRRLQSFSAHDQRNIHTTIGEKSIIPRAPNDVAQSLSP